jgi:hypothetical protein
MNGFEKLGRINGPWISARFFVARIYASPGNLE